MEASKSAQAQRSANCRSRAKIDKLSARRESQHQNMAEFAFSFSDFHMRDVSDDLIKECAKLFSEHYGVWNAKGFKPGHHVQLSPQRLRTEYLFDPDTCRLAVARHTSGELAAQAFYCNFLYVPSGKHVVWITQLVVKSKFRGCHLARKLLVQPCSDKGLFACALVTSHPYAVRALESATNRQCDPGLTFLHVERIVKASCIPYPQDRQSVVSVQGDGKQRRRVLLTDFQVDHTEADQRHMALANWQLGDLEDGENFLAIWPR